MKIACRVGELRRARGISAPDLARAAGVTRQALYAIEAGQYVPNTTVALKLARTLEVAVEELFALPEEPAAPQPLTVEYLSNAGEAQAGSPVRLVKHGTKVMAAPAWAPGHFLPPSDALLLDANSATSWAAPEEALLIAGCDPALGLLADAAAREAGLRIVPVAASSGLALEWLRAGQVHVAGCHLLDTHSGEFNLPQVKTALGRNAAQIFTFAEWEEGFVVARGNPLGIRRAADLARPGVRFVNREKGSGSRALLDRILHTAGIGPSQVSGYGNTATGHLPAALSVATGAADVCLATSSAALALDLDFVELQPERYDFVIPEANLELPGVRALLDLLQRGSFRRRLAGTAGYEVARTGTRFTSSEEAQPSRSSR